MKVVMAFRCVVGAVLAGTAFISADAASSYRGTIVAADSLNAPEVWETKDPRSHVGLTPNVPIRLLISPPLEKSVHVSWRVSGDAFTVSDTETPTDSPPSLLYRSQGFGTLSAFLPDEIRPIATRVIYSYDSIFVGCAAFTRSHGIFFDPYGTARDAETPAKSDLYVMAPHCNFWGDETSPFDSAGPPTLHYPGGGIRVPMPSGGFAHIKTTQWRNAGTATAGSGTTGDVLIFKTRDGRVTKVSLSASNLEQIDGPYAVQSGNRAFYDEADLSNSNRDGITL